MIGAHYFFINQPELLMAQSVSPELLSLSKVHHFTDSSGFQLPFRIILLIKYERNNRATLIFLHGAGERGDDNVKQLHWVINQIVEHSTKQKYLLI